MPNSDGVHGLLVAAKNQKEALRLMGSSVYSFKAYDGRRTDDPELIGVAMREPGRVFKQVIHYVGPKNSNPRVPT